MQPLEVSDAVRHIYIYIYIYVIRRLRVNQGYKTVNSAWIYILCSILEKIAGLGGRSPSEMVGSNPTGNIDACLLWLWCVVGYGSLQWADHSSRGVPPTVLRLCVWSRNLVNEETLACVGLQRHWRENVEQLKLNYNGRYDIISCSKVIGIFIVMQ